MVREQPGKREGFFWMSLAVIVGVLAWRTDIGSFQEPGPGFVAFITGLFLFIIGLLMALSEAFSKISGSTTQGSGGAFNRASLRRLLFTVGLLIGYALLLDTLGYILSTSLVMWGLFYQPGRNRWSSSLLASLVTVGFSYLIFEILLRCQLPRGIFPWW